MAGEELPGEKPKSDESLPEASLDKHEKLQDSNPGAASEKEPSEAVSDGGPDGRTRARSSRTKSVKVSNISIKATEKDIYDFFVFAGEITDIQTEANEDQGTQIAFVSFLEEKAFETALLLSGSVIADKAVVVEPALGYVPPPKKDGQTAQAGAPGLASSPVIKKAESMVTDLLAKGYVLGQDAMAKARDFDSRHELSRSAAAKAAALRENAAATAASLDRRMGLSQKITATSATVNQSIVDVDEKYHLSERTRGAFEVAETKLSQAGQALLQNKFVASGRDWFVGAYGKVSEAVEGVGSKTMEKVRQEGGGVPAAEAAGGAAEPAVEGSSAATAGEGLAQLHLADQGPPLAPPPAHSTATTTAPAPAASVSSSSAVAPVQESEPIATIPVVPATPEPAPKPADHSAKATESPPIF